MGRSSREQQTAAMSLRCSGYAVDTALIAPSCHHCRRRPPAGPRSLYLFAGRVGAGQL